MKIIKSFSLLLAGILIGIIATLFNDYIIKHLILIIILTFVLLVIGFGLHEQLYIIYLRLIFFINKRLKKMALFIPYEINSHNSSWVDVSNEEILKELKKSKIKFDTIKKDKYLKKYPIVLNPYGGTYIEEDVSTLMSLDNILLYVRNGGIYINIADIPFYYAYDKKLERMVDTTPLVGDFSQDRSFLKSILTEKLHCFVFALTSGVDFDLGVERIIELTDNAINLFDRKISIGGIERKYSPFLAIPYGRGYFIFSTFHINKNEEKKISQMVNKVLELKI